MKRLMTLLNCLACSSCISTPTAFIQGDIRVVPPVNPETDASGNRITYMVNDGGSWGYKMVDSRGHEFQIRFDRSFIIENGKVVGNQPGTIYISSPETKGLVKVIDQDGFRRIILRGSE